MKNIVFDLAGVVFARNVARCPQSLMDYFYFINSGEAMPEFWNDYDRGTRDIDSVAECLAAFRGSDFETAKSMMLSAITYQEQVVPTAELIAELKQAGYRLFVLSNMSKEYIAYLRRMDVYRHFEGEIISCETGLIKPEKAIYELLLQRYSLDPSQTIFIDDRAENVAAAAEVGITPFHFDRNNPEKSCEQLRDLLK
ncbi:MAG: HAD-IA family hydrolase [Alistipes sp.]|nr:HAD-IA family hydrolase [Alistipes sp.]